MYYHDALPLKFHHWQPLSIRLRVFEFLLWWSDRIMGHFSINFPWKEKDWIMLHIGYWWLRNKEYKWQRRLTIHCILFGLNYYNGR